MFTRPRVQWILPDCLINRSILVREYVAEEASDGQRNAWRVGLVRYVHLFLARHRRAGSWISHEAWSME